MSSSENGILPNKIISSAPPTTLSITSKTSWRISAMDIQRGIIMLLMSFAHCREYVGAEHYANYFYFMSAKWEGNSTLDILQQIFVTLLVSGGFFMMMGIGIVFLYYTRLKNGWSNEKTCLYLVKRGCLLVLLQLTLLEAFEVFSSKHFYIGVLFALGINMMISSLLIYSLQKVKLKFSIKHSWLEYVIPLSIALFIMIAIQLITNALQSNLIQPNFWLTALILGGNNYYNTDIDFTPIPWFPAVAFGLVIGQLLYSYRENSFKYLMMISLSLLMGFFIIRTGNLLNWFHFGGYKLLPPGEALSFASYFAISKYPPSITYFLWSFGINIFCICLWQFTELNIPWIFNCIKPVKIFGQCALFFFITHWFVYYFISQLIPTLAVTPMDIAKLWLMGLIPLYLLCLWFYAIKSSKSPDSIWRMF
jgi:uncharacterized membrane protein